MQLDYFCVKMDAELSIVQKIFMSLSGGLVFHGILNALILYHTYLNHES